MRLATRPPLIAASISHPQPTPHGTFVPEDFLSFLPVPRAVGGMERRMMPTVVPDDRVTGPAASQPRSAPPTPALTRRKSITP